MSRATLLVVDDDAALLVALTDMIQLHLDNVDVHTFTSPRLALAHLEKEDVSTIVTDLKMPELDGLALLRGAKAIRPHISMVLCTGTLSPSLALHAFELGVLDVLAKPFSRDHFLATIQSALQVHAVWREVEALSRPILGEASEALLEAEVRLQDAQQRLTAAYLKTHGVVLQRLGEMRAANGGSSEKQIGVSKNRS